jgi:hypothetical protein
MHPQVAAAIVTVLAAADTMLRLYNARTVFAFAKRGFNLSRAAAAALSVAALVWLVLDIALAGGVNPKIRTNPVR